MPESPNNPLTPLNILLGTSPSKLRSHLEHDLTTIRKRIRRAKKHGISSATMMYTVDKLKVIAEIYATTAMSMVNAKDTKEMYYVSAAALGRLESVRKDLEKVDKIFGGIDEDDGEVNGERKHLMRNWKTSGDSINGIKLDREDTEEIKKRRFKDSELKDHRLHRKSRDRELIAGTRKISEPENENRKNGDRRLRGTPEKSPRVPRRKVTFKKKEADSHVEQSFWSGKSQKTRESPGEFTLLGTPDLGERRRQKQIQLLGYGYDECSSMRVPSAPKISTVVENNFVDPTSLEGREDYTTNPKFG